MPLWIFMVFYVATGLVGAILVTNDSVFALWSLMFPTMDARWLAPGSTATYWIIVLGPLVVVPLLIKPSMNAWRRPTVVLTHALSTRPSPVATAIVATGMFAYCVANLSRYGYLGVGLFSETSLGAYRDNIVLRTQMFSVLGDLHFSLMFAAIPALAIVALYSAVRERTFAWWALFGGLSVGLLWLYMTTLTKSNVLIFGVAVAAASYHLGIVKLKGLAGFGFVGVIVLAFLDFLLSGADPFALLRTLLNVVFRVSSGIPFYLAVFPEQMPYVGLDIGLSRFGIGPVLPANQIVANYMFPADTWVQSAAPAPAHVMAYAQGGIFWSLFTMGLIGALVGFASALGNVARSPLGCSAFIGACMACYYASQTEFAGVFQHSYGYLSWLLALFILLLIDRLLRFAVSARCPQSMAAEASEVVAP